MKRFLGLLGIVVFCAAAPAPPLGEILVAEHARSLAGLPALLDREPLVATRAALAIGRTKDPKGAVPLRAHLGASDPALRAMVVYALGLLADRPSRDALVRLALSDPNSAVRYAAVDAVGRIAVADIAGSAGAAHDLLRVASTDRDPVVRAHAAANLDAFRTAPGAQQIAFALQTAFAREHDAAVRWHIVWTLSRAYPTQTSRAFFVKALTDSSDLVRLGAVRGLGRQKDTHVAAALRPLLDDPSWRVQEETTEALRRLDSKNPTDHLTALQPGLHLPPLGAQADAGPAVAARPSPAPTTGPPGVADIPSAPPLNPTSAALMNGPMPGLHPRVRIATTKGDVVLRLYPEWAPYTVANFLNLTSAGYFDGNRWFRIVPDFVVQTGDKKNTGDGDAGYLIGAEENPVEQRAGIIAMGLDYDDKTNTPKRDSAGSQFYITLSPQLHLDRDFSVFGEVESGFDVLAHLVEADSMNRVERIADD